jgi:uncharacterized protein YcfL
MKTYFYTIIIFVTVLAGCSAWKEMLVAEGNHNVAVQNAIYDFIHTEGRLTKQARVYDVIIDTISNEILGISISGYEDKLVIHPKNKIGTNHPYFPTRYVEIDNKLFYWYDSESNITSELIDALSRYSKIDSSFVKGTYELNVVFDDSKKGVDYYFCKNNLLKYKKVRGTIAMGWYEPPRLKCKRE